MNVPSIGNFLNSWALILKIDTEGKKMLINAYGNVFRTWTMSTLFAELAARELVQGQISSSVSIAAISKNVTPAFPRLVNSPTRKWSLCTSK